MYQDLPHGSKIDIRMCDGDEQIVVPHLKGSVTRYFMGAFMLVWLCGWSMGWRIPAGAFQGGNVDTFLFVWSILWVLGWVYAAFCIYRAFRIPVPEQLLLNKPKSSFDSGIPPLVIHFGFGYQKEYWKSMFYKRKRYEFTREEFGTLKLRETDSQNRLTIDSGKDRIELAASATEIEREWLFHYLQAFYS